MEFTSRERNLCYVISTMSRTLVPKDTTGERLRCSKDGEFDFIPLDPVMFMDGLEKAVEGFIKVHEKPPRSFLEIGCGVGTFINLVSRLHCGMKCHGLEKNKLYIPVAQRLCGSGAIIEGDALTFDKYGDYDLLYFYMPFSRGELAKQFIDRLLVQAKGIIFGANYGVQESPLHNISNSMFVYSSKLSKLIAI